jgi:hypothetical protein
MAEYFRVTESSAWIRARLRMKDMSDPLDRRRHVSF